MDRGGRGAAQRSERGTRLGDCHVWGRRRRREIVRIKVQAVRAERGRKLAMDVVHKHISLTGEKVSYYHVRM